MKYLFFSEFAVLKYYYLIFGALIIIASITMYFLTDNSFKGVQFVFLFSSIIGFFFSSFSVNRTTKKKLLVVLPVERKHIVRYSFLKILVPAVILFSIIVLLQFFKDQKNYELLGVFHIITIVSLFDTILSFKNSNINKGSFNFGPSYSYLFFIVFFSFRTKIVLPLIIFNPFFAAIVTLVLFIVSYFISLKIFLNADVENNSDKFHRREIERRFEKVFLGRKVS